MNGGRTPAGARQFSINGRGWKAHTFVLTHFARLGHGTQIGQEPPNALRRCSKSEGGFCTMVKAEQYRRFARECMEMAGTFVSERARAALVHMAQVWLRLADEKEVEHEEADRES